MVPRQIREHGGVEVESVNPVERQRVRGYLHRGVGSASPPQRGTDHYQPLAGFGDHGPVQKEGPGKPANRPAGIRIDNVVGSVERQSLRTLQATQNHRLVAGRIDHVDRPIAQGVDKQVAAVIDHHVIRCGQPGNPPLLEGGAEFPDAPTLVGDHHRLLLVDDRADRSGHAGSDPAGGRPVRTDTPENSVRAVRHDHLVAERVQADTIDPLLAGPVRKRPPEGHSLV